LWTSSSPAGAARVSARRASWCWTWTATHVPLHGAQERGFFHGYYDKYCYLPLYVFCGQDLLACVLRPSDRDPASVVTALLKRLIDALRQAWPKVRIVVRGDSGFCRPRVLRRLNRWDVDYVLGLQKNTRLLQRTELAELALAEQYQARGTKQRMFGSFEYAADSWDRPRPWPAGCGWPGRCGGAWALSAAASVPRE
jgi:hypothetical protein